MNSSSFVPRPVDSVRRDYIWWHVGDVIALYRPAKNDAETRSCFDQRNDMIPFQWSWSCPDAAKGWTRLIDHLGFAA